MWHKMATVLMRRGSVANSCHVCLRNGLVILAKLIGSTRAATRANANETGTFSGSSPGGAGQQIKIKT